MSMRCGAGRAGHGFRAVSTTDYQIGVHVAFVLKIPSDTKWFYKASKMVYDVYCFMKRAADNNAVYNLKQCTKRNEI